MENMMKEITLVNPTFNDEYSFYEESSSGLKEILDTNAPELEYLYSEVVILRDLYTFFDGNTEKVSETFIEILDGSDLVENGSDLYEMFNHPDIPLIREYWSHWRLPYMLEDYIEELVDLLSPLNVKMNETGEVTYL